MYLLQHCNKLLSTGIVILLLCCVPKLAGQQITGSILGSVQDATHAAVVGVSVKLTNTGTGNTQTAASDAAGNFQFRQLPSGTYVLEASSPGFRSYRQEGITVETADELTIPVVLTIGDASQTIEVKANAAMLETTSSSVATEVSRQMTEELPMVARNPYGLANLVPTVKGVNYFGNQVLTTNSSGLVNIGGASPASNGFLVDGTANDKLGDSPGVQTYLTADAVEEFKIITNAIPAEFGRTMGGIVSVISRSGTNQYHGSASDFLRNGDLNANDFFSNLAGKPKGPLVLNQFGGVLGGPIKKNKLFFFINYEGYRERRTVNRVVTAPTLAERAGNFSNAFTSAGKPITIYDPLTTVTNASTGVSTRLPFQGNIIPLNRLSAVSQAIFANYPAPNVGGPNNLTNNLAQSTYNPVNRDTGGVKGDYIISDNQRMSVRYTKDVLNWQTDCYYCNAGQATVAQSLLDNGNRRLYYVPRTSASFNYFDSITPTLLFEAKMGLNRDFDHGYPISTELGGFNVTQWGFPGSFAAQLPKIKFAETGLTPSINITGIQGVGGAVSEGRAGTTWSNGAALTKLMSAHTVKFGVDYRFYSHNPFDGSVPTFTFNSAFTQGPNPNTASSTAGLGVASFDLGYAATGSFTYQPEDTKSDKYTGLYVQDDWKVSSKLTLNLGLRWEYESPLTDRFNVFSNWDPTLVSPLQAPGMSQILGGIQFPGVNGDPRGVFDPKFDHFGPRIGYAYTILPNKLVVRSAYGINYVPIKGSGEWFDRTGYSSLNTMITSLNGGLTPYNTIDNPFPSGLVPPTNSSLGAATGLGGNIYAQPRDFTAGYGQIYNFTLQYQPRNDWLVEGAFVGNKGVHLMSGTLDVNQLNPAYMSLGSKLNTLVTNPFYGNPLIPASSPLSLPTITLAQSLLPYPQFTGVGAGTYTNLGNSNYLAFTVKVEHRFSNGFSLLLAYNKSKLITDATTNSNWAGILDEYNFQPERGLGTYDIPQRLVISALYSLPFGQGTKGFRQWVTAGWQVNTIVTLSSGPTIQFLSGQPSTASFIATSAIVPRPNVVAGVSPLPANQSWQEWFNTAAFSPAPAFTYGNAPVSIPNVHAPSIYNVDFSIFKNFSVTERFKVQLRGAAFNLFNSAEFQGPATNVTSASTFGVISSTGVTGTIYTPLSREVQLALRLIF